LTHHENDFWAPLADFRRRETLQVAKHLDLESQRLRASGRTGVKIPLNMGSTIKNLYTIPLMSVKQCHEPAIWGKHTRYIYGDWGMIMIIYCDIMGIEKKCDIMGISWAIVVTRKLI